MAWFRVDDGFHCHPKVLKAGNEAIGLYVRCGAYAAQHLTDGFIPEHIVLLYGSETLAEALVKAGLWRRARGGWRMPDYLDYNPSKEQVLKEREKTRERVRRHRESAGRKAKSNAVTTPVTNAVSNRPPSPSRPEGTGTGTNTGSQSSSRRNARGWADDDESINSRIIQLIKELTGRDITTAEADRIRHQILDGRHVKHRSAYVVRAIQDNPDKFLLGEPAAQVADAPPLKVVPEWCGFCSADDYRWMELPDGKWAKCPACNPDATKEAAS